MFEIQDGVQFENATVVFFSVNGNWFDGTWRDGNKNGNGKFYFSDKGQIYEGIWVDGVARCGALSDFGRDEASSPTQYPIPKVAGSEIRCLLCRDCGLKSGFCSTFQLWLDDMDEILKEAMAKVLVRLEEKWKATKKQRNSQLPTITEGNRNK